MKHAPITPPDQSPEQDDDFAQYIGDLPPCPGIPVTDEEVAAMEKRSRADIAAGRVYPHAIVGEWLKTWGQPDFRPFKEWMSLRDG